MEGVKTLIYFSILLLWRAYHYACAQDTYANETALRTLLESGYKTDVRPSTPTSINILYSIRVLDSLDITSQTMTVMGWMATFWTDPRLTWNASDYSNISQLDANWVWRPAFAVTNSADSIALYGYVNDDARFRVYDDGTVRWIQPILQETTCDVDITKFPFDSQTCHIEVVFWGSNRIDLVQNITSQVADAAYLENAEWIYDGGSAYDFPIQVCCPAQIYDVINIELKFTRLRPFYIINLIIPALLLALCMLLAFLLPTECGERLGYSLTILLSYTVLLTITSDMMPTTSKQTPHIAMFLLVLLVYCSLAVVNVVIGVKIFYLETKPPSFLKKLTYKLQPIVYMECCKASKKVEPSESDTHIVMEDELKPPAKRPITAFSEDAKSDNSDLHDEITWVDISNLQDRLCLYIYTLATTVLVVVFLINMYS